MKRKDGIRIKDADPMYQVAAYVMNKRVDAMNMITLDIPLDPMVNYVREKKQEGVRLSRLAVVIAAYLRCVAQYPELNRFVVNSKLYARNEIAIGMVVLKNGITGGGTMSKIKFQPTDDVFAVQKRIDEYVEQNRNAEPDNGTEKMIKILLSVPGLVKVGVAVFRFMDKHGMLPKSVIDMSPFHISMVLTDLASIRTKSIYHHVYEFGTTSISLAMGITREIVKSRDGKVEAVKCMPLGMVMDERITDGSYFAIAFHDFEQYMKHPERLEGPPQIIHPEIREIFNIKD